MKTNGVTFWIGVVLWSCCVLPVRAIVTEDISRSEDDPANYAPYTDFDWDYVYSVNDASGVAVDPYWVLTAAHVGISDIERGAVTHEVVESFTHFEADLRLIRYDTPFPGFYPIYTGTFPLPPPPHVDKLTGLMVGYGRTGNVLSDTTYEWHGSGTAGTKRWGDSLIDNVGDGTTKYIQLNFDTNATDYAAGAADKDSGGGVFVQDEGTWYLAGTMYTVGTLENGDNTTLAVRLSEYEPWITQTIPEPATGMFFLLGSAILLVVARRLRAA